MRRTPFDGLRTVRLAQESQTGCAEVCQGPDGTYWARLRVQSPACQRELLSALDETVPVRLESGALELLLPWHEGISARHWLHEQQPTLGRRRDACLSLLEQQVELSKKLPPCLTALSAAPENLAAESAGLSLQYLPDFRHWTPGMEEAQAVCAVAAVIGGILAPEPGRRVPEELQLLHLRQKSRDYTSWGQLQRDVAAIPDEPPPGPSLWRPRARHIQNWLSRCGTHILRALAALLLTAALLSLLSAYRRWNSGQGPVWPGMPQVGGQNLRNEEGGG